MSHNITIARKAAWSLSRTLMAPVVLFCIEGQFGIMEASEYDGDEDSVVHEFDPHAQ